MIALKNFQNYIGIFSEILICLGIVLGFTYLGMQTDILHFFPTFFFQIELYLFGLALLISAIVAYLTWTNNEKIFADFQSLLKYFPKNETYFVLFAVAVCLFIIPLFTTWTTAEFHQNNVGGLFPIFDAGAYYSGAEHILDTGRLDSWNQRRPINSMFLATRLLLTNFDFRSTLILQAMILGISVFLVSLSISRTLGKSAGFLMFAVLFTLSSFYLSDNLSENLGLVFGCLSFSLIWIGIFERNFHSYLIGIFFLSIGFMVRPGPFLLFPVLFLLSGSIFSLESHFDWKKVILSSVPALLGLFLNQIIISLYSDGKGLFMGNYATVLYGLASGGKGWQQAMIDFPYESTHYPESQLAPFLYQKSFELIHAAPLQFLNTVLQGYITGPFNLINQLFQQLISIEYSTNPLLNQYGFTIFLVGLISITIGIIRFFLYSDLKYIKSLFLFSLFTTFLVLPFFFVDGGLRTLVIIFPYFAIGIIMGTIGWRSKGAIQESPVHKESQNHSLFSVTIPVIIGLIILASATTTLTFGPELKEIVLGHQPEISPDACSINETFFIMRVDRGIPFLEMMEAGHLSPSFAPYVNPDEFTSPSERYYLSYYYELTDFINGKDFPVLFSGYDLQFHETRIILAPNGIVEAEHRTIGFCAESNNVTKYPVYWVYRMNPGTIKYYDNDIS